jgi:hypothetical protein
VVALASAGYVMLRNFLLNCFEILLPHCCNLELPLSFVHCTPSTRLSNDNACDGIINSLKFIPRRLLVDQGPDMSGLWSKLHLPMHRCYPFVNISHTLDVLPQ